MRVTLVTEQGPAAGKTAALVPNKSLYVGRSDTSHLVVDDPALAMTQFVLVCEERRCQLRDLSGRGTTLVNGHRVDQVELRDGDRISVGQSTFIVRFGDGPTPVPALSPIPSAAPPPTTAALTRTVPTSVVSQAPPVTVAAPASGPQSVLAVLRAVKDPLFALVDAARGMDVYAHLLKCPERYQSLYEGPQGDALALHAPYLVQLPPHSSYLETLVKEGWGNSWGMYLTCPLSFEDIRTHFRHFLLVKTEEGEQLYFRFYDPRVLRKFLPTCTADELAQLFGPIRSFLMEENPQTLLVCTRQQNTLCQSRIPVAVQGRR